MREENSHEDKRMISSIIGRIFIIRYFSSILEWEKYGWSRKSLNISFFLIVTNDRPMTDVSSISKSSSLSSSSWLGFYSIRYPSDYLFTSHLSITFPWSLISTRSHSFLALIMRIVVTMNSDWQRIQTCVSYLICMHLCGWILLLLPVAFFFFFSSSRTDPPLMIICWT